MYKTGFLFDQPGKAINVINTYDLDAVVAWRKGHHWGDNNSQGGWCIISCKDSRLRWNRTKKSFDQVGLYEWSRYNYNEKEEANEVLETVYKRFYNRNAISFKIDFNGSGYMVTYR